MTPAQRFSRGIAHPLKTRALTKCGPDEGPDEHSQAEIEGANYKPRTSGMSSALVFFLFMTRFRAV
jgi:hypothetical protein